MSPGTSPVTFELGEVGVVIVAVPETTFHPPFPTEGVFAESVAVDELQIIWSLPATAIVGNKSTFIVTSSVEGGQTPFEIVH